MGLEVGGGVCPSTFPEEQQFLFLPELVPPAIEEEEGGCVASAFHRAVSLSVGVGSNQNTGGTEKGKNKNAQGSVRHNRMCLLDGS